LLANLALLNSKWVIHNWIEDGAKQPEWLNAIVVHHAKDLIW